MTAKRVQGRTVPQRSLVNRVSSKYLRKCTIKNKCEFFLMQQYLPLWVFVNSMCAITVIQCPTGFNYKSGCTKNKKAESVSGAASLCGNCSYSLPEGC